MTGMRARCLAGSGLREAFEAHLDVAGHILALSWSTPTGSCQAQGSFPVLPQDWSFAEVQRAPTRMPARGPSLHPSRPAFSGQCHAPDPGHASQDHAIRRHMHTDALAPNQALPTMSRSLHTSKFLSVRKSCPV